MLQRAGIRGVFSCGKCGHQSWREIKAQNVRRSSTSNSVQRQYRPFKEAHPDCLVFFQFGSFYEMFDKQALLASKLFNIRIARSAERGLEMAGVPLKAAEKYKRMGIAAGLRIVIVKQAEEAAPFGRLRDRWVSEVLTPGTYVPDTDASDGSEGDNGDDFDEFVDGRLPQGSGLVVLSAPKEIPSVQSSNSVPEFGIGVAKYDAETGEISILESTSSSILGTLENLRPVEIVAPNCLEFVLSPKSYVRDSQREIQSSDSEEIPQSFFNFTYDGHSPCLLHLIDKSHQSNSMKHFNNQDVARKHKAMLERIEDELSDLQAAAMIFLLQQLKYRFQDQPLFITSTQLITFESEDDEVAVVHEPESLKTTYMQLDASVVSDLELFKTVSSSSFGFSNQLNRQNTLFGLINNTKTTVGRKLLRKRLELPVTDVNIINERLDSIENLTTNVALREGLRDFLKQIAARNEFHKFPKKLAMGVASEEHLLSMAETLAIVFKHGKPCYDASVEAQGRRRPSELSKVLAKLKAFSEDMDLLNLVSDVKATIASVELDQLSFVLPGVNARLDELTELLSVLKNLENVLREKYNTDVLKVVEVNLKKVPRQLIEVPKKDADRLRKFDDIKEEQRLAKTVRFSSSETRMADSEKPKLEAEIAEIERDILTKFRARFNEVNDVVNEIINCLAILDVSNSLFLSAKDHNLTRPVVNNSFDLKYNHGRHLVVSSKKSAFVSNNLNLSPSHESTWLITGPNMGGKSTFLRQTAHIQILAQMGSFVPCEDCEVGMVNRIITRLGSSDDVAQDKSTFFLEMEEIAAVLKNATKRSLVLVDEVGRGTAAKDGSAISQAVLESLLQKECRTLFATHHQEISRVSKSYPTLGFYRFGSVPSTFEGSKGVTTLNTYKLSKGIAWESYGINAARLAQLPEEVTNRAQEILDSLDSLETPVVDDISRSS